MKNQNEWCNNCQSRDCECVEPIKYTPPNMNTEGKKYNNNRKRKKAILSAIIGDKIKVSSFQKEADMYRCSCEKQTIGECNMNYINTPTAQWQKCGEDCDCKDECKQLLADTPQIMQELSNRDKWQKEAEELSWKEFPMNHLTPKGEKETIIENRGIYVLGFIKARKLAHTEHQQELSIKEAAHAAHAAHLAQLQGEIDRYVNLIDAATIGHLDHMQREDFDIWLTRLRTITQTKMKGE